MRIQFTPQLQRDMYHGWDSSSSAIPAQKLNIKNVDKLIGLKTGISETHWMCIWADDKGDSYQFLFKHNTKDISIEVNIFKTKQVWNDKIYVKLIQNISHKTLPLISSVEAHEFNFLTSKAFLGWVDRQLDNKLIETENYIWKQTPFHKKVAIKFKDFINNMR
jgi:hypothetical protein